jgi:hypothetical protein
MRRARRTIGLMLATMLVTGLFAVTATGAQATGTSTKAGLTLVHGIDGPGGFPVDISVYRLAVGSQVFHDVTYGTVAGPLELGTGLYRVAIRPADAPRYSRPILSRWVWLRPGSNTSVVAHLSATGTPMISVYGNDLRDSGPNTARVTVRHNAAVGPVNVAANGTRVITRLANPHQAVLDVPATTIQIRVRVAGTGPVVFNAPVRFAEDTNTIIYATLDRNGNFNPLLQVLPTA